MAMSQEHKDLIDTVENWTRGMECSINTLDEYIANSGVERAHQITEVGNVLGELAHYMKVLEKIWLQRET